MVIVLVHSPTMMLAVSGPPLVGRLRPCARLGSTRDTRHDKWPQVAKRFACLKRQVQWSPDLQNWCWLHWCRHKGKQRWRKMILNDEWSEWSGDLQAFPRTRCHVLWLHGTGHFAGLLTLQLVEWRGFGQCTSDLLWHETRLEGCVLSYENKSRCWWLGCCLCNSSYSCVTVIAVFSDLMIMRTWCLWPVEGGQGIHFSAGFKS